MTTIAYSHIQVMHPKLEQLYLRLEKTRNRLLDELEGLDDDLLNSKPTAEKWSINQIVAHMLLVEKVTASYVHRKLETPEELEDSSLKSSFKSLLMKVLLKTGIKFKAPSVVANVPATADLLALRYDWDQLRYKLEDILTEIPDYLLYKNVFNHPKAGPLTVHQTLHFLQDHFDHHLRQIQQRKASLLRG
ncbi:DinB family protein [Pontibacter harenae]|uniref:DinB family protein n=1 Tax=Pontibacter harenae TaxID=2894083 RepID=UPI001E422744|nr:DinB family protein [Pontibacter harenae]MCC9166608.1 DinB family protein [Pontibacter harenae]